MPNELKMLIFFEQKTTSDLIEEGRRKTCKLGRGETGGVDGREKTEKQKKFCEVERFVESS